MKIKKSRLITVGAIAAASALVLSACATEDVEPSATASATQAPVEQEVITVWADEAEVPGLKAAALQFEADTGILVELVVKEAVRDDFTAVPAAESPDVVLGAHDWQGLLVSTGLIAPLELGGRADGFITGSINAFNYDGQQYGLPYAQENVALVCTETAMPTAPATFQDAIDAGLAISMNDGVGDPYHMYALQTSFGATVFEIDEAGSYTSTLGMDNAAGYSFASWLSDNSDIFDLSNNTDIVKGQLISGDKGCWITGPWSGVWFTETFGEDGWNAFEIPSAGGEPAAQFSGVRGAMLSANSDNPVAAAKFIVDYLGSEAGQTAMFSAGGRSPANLAALKAAGDTKIPSQFGAAGINAMPMPAIPAMNSVWSFWGSTQVSIIKGDGDSATLWQKMCEDINAAIVG
jgi:arabinogalactan oligomer/maltooligosaccharide transport system substrate-binding protein